LETAKVAVAEGCDEYIRWAALFSKRLGSINQSEFHRFARALALVMLGNLPTRPATCPFCIQYGQDRRCQGCGYAATHGRCDSDDSSFSLFIEAFQELGKAIYQDVQDLQSRPADSQIIKTWLDDSAKASRKMKEGIRPASSVSTFSFMEQKAYYLDEMLCLIPVNLFSKEIDENCRMVRKRLLDYW
jgi:hypothetical protein